MHDHVLYPYVPVPSGINAEEVFAADEQHFRTCGEHSSFVRRLAQGEFPNEPPGLKGTLRTRPAAPFCFMVFVTVRRRYPVQIRAVPGFDPERPGVVTAGQVRNASAEAVTATDLFYGPLGQYERR